MEHVFVAEDVELVRKLAVLLNKSKQRENDVDTVADKLYKEVEELGSYLSLMIGNIESSELFSDTKSILQEALSKPDASRQQTLLSLKS